MIINQEESDSYNERNTSPFHKKIHLLSEKIEDKISSLKKNSFRNNTFKTHNIEVKNYGNKNNNYQYNTIIPYNKKHHSKIRFKIPKNREKDYRIKKIDNIDNIYYNQKYSTIIAKNRNYNDNYNDDEGNDSEKENIRLIPHTSRYNNDKKEKYLNKFLKDVIKFKYDNDDINRDYYTVRVNRSPFEYINQKKSFSHKIRNEPIVNDVNELNHNDSSIKLEEKLDYEFEIRLLAKKLKELKERNKKLKYRIIKIKNEQRIRKQKNKKIEYIISKVIQICKNASFSGANNFFSSFKEIYNTQFNNNSEENKIDELSLFPATNLFKNMLLNLMDMKYEFENIVLKDKFIDGVQNLFYNNNEEYKEFDETNNNNKIFIYDNVRNLISEEAKLKNECNEYLELGKCVDYFSQLCKNLNIDDLKELVDYLKKIFIKTKVNFKQINQIKKIVTDINNTNKEINNNNNIDEKYRDMHHNNFSGKRYLRKKNNSEIKITNKNSSLFKEEIKNSKQNSYIKDMNNINNTILTNKDNYLYNKIFYTLRCNNNNINDSVEKNQNTSLSKEKIDIFDFNNQRNFGYFINEYTNKKKENISQAKNNSNLSKKKMNNLHYNKSSKIRTLKSAKKINDKTYNTIINLKKKELGLNNKIRNKIKSYIKDKKNKNEPKSIVKDFIYSLK